MKLPVLLQFQNTPEFTIQHQFDIASFEGFNQLYRLAWNLTYEDTLVSTDVEFRGFSSQNQLVLQDNVTMPAGHIVHESVDRPVGGQIGLDRFGRVVLLVMQWRRREEDWEWFRADDLAWKTFRVMVREVFAHCVPLAQFGMLAVNRHQNFQTFDRAPQTVQLLFQTFGSHWFQKHPIPAVSLQFFRGHLGLYEYLSKIVFGRDADNFRPVNFRGMVSNIPNIQQENADGSVDVNLPGPNQTVGGRLRGQFGHLTLEGVVMGQLGINAQRQLVLLLIRWRAAGETGWNFYVPQVHQWEEFQSAVREIFAYAVLVAQF